jgi:tetratricopeptide (TPR) repeat protein
MTDDSLLTLSTTEFTRRVRDAFKSYASLLELSLSPLATSPLVTPALVLDVAAPTPDDRGRALRVVLRWAVNRLAPTPPHYPLGQSRPFDDPTWTDPLWWRYNILRHRYLEPLRPDDLDDLRSRGLTDALLALTGIPGSDRLYAERDRAIQEVSTFLQQQLVDHQGGEELRRLAVEELYQSLEWHTLARDLLGLAAIFQGVFPRTLLLEMAAAERWTDAAAALDHLIAHRLLLEGDNRANLLVPPILQEHVQTYQAHQAMTRRHQHAAQFFLERGRPLQAAWHLRMSGSSAQAAELLLEVASSLIEAWQIEELREALQGFTEQGLAPAQWCEVQLLLCDLFRKTGSRVEALAACRRALKSAKDPVQRARLYHRLGKLYEDHNPMHALGYYRQAAERFPPDAPEFVELLTDRAWLHLHRRRWEQAEGDLVAAMEKASPTAWYQRANILDALAGLYRRQQQYKRAISYARQALFIREERGDLQQVADSYNNLGSIYAEMGESTHAQESFEEALEIFERLGNREAAATAQLNFGGALYYAGRFPEAIDLYDKSLHTFQELALPRGQAQAHYNLAEAFAEMGQDEQACQHWREGYLLSRQAELDDQLAWFSELRDATPALQGIMVETPGKQVGAPSDQPQVPSDLVPEEQIALELAQRHGRVTTRLLMEQAHISKATATRRLSALARRGLLVRVGKGRATCYVVPEG